MTSGNSNKILELNKEQVITWGQQVCSAESSAIEKISERLDDNFFNAVKTILNCRGKTVVTGLGKSGVYCQKNGVDPFVYRHTFFLSPSS